MDKKGIIFSLFFAVCPGRELAVGFGELRVYIHARVVGGSTVSTLGICKKRQQLQTAS